MHEKGAHGKIQKKEESLQKGEKDLATWEEYRNVVRACREAMRKVHLELILMREIKDNRKSFFKYISSKRKTVENVGPLLNEFGALVMEDT